MRILFVSHARKDPDGGASRVYHLLEEGLAARGHYVKTLHYEDFGISPATERVVSRLFLAQAASRRAAKEDVSSYDVVMASNGVVYALFKELQKKQKRPLLVSHLHGSALFDQQATLSETARGHMSVSLMYRSATGSRPVKWDYLGSKYADLTIVQNQRDQDLIVEQGFSPVSFIPMAVHPAILESGRSAPAPSQRDASSLLWFGSWVERKGRFYLPRAFKQIVQRYPHCHLTIGGTNLEAGVVRKSFDPELWPNITVLPRVSLQEQLEIYRRHTVFLFPSLSEGFGFALLEAMSMGLAAVTTDTGFAGDWLTSGKDAMIVPAASAIHLAQGVMKLLEDGNLRCSIARSGQLLSRLFTIDRCVDAYEAAFEEHSCKLDRNVPARAATIPVLT